MPTKLLKLMRSREESVRDSANPKIIGVWDGRRRESNGPLLKVGSFLILSMSGARKGNICARTKSTIIIAGTFLSGSV